MLPFPLHRTVLWLLLAGVSVPTLPASAQQDPSWQGTRSHQSPIPTSRPQDKGSTLAPQSPLPSTPQPTGEDHPQIIEVPATQLPSSRSLQPETSSTQTLPPSAPQPNLSSRQPPPSTQSSDIPAKPAYFGATGKTALACRYPEGVRIAQVIEGSPAHHAGLKGETMMSWKQAIGNGPSQLPVTPPGPLSRPSYEHGGRGDLILAVDGKRIHNTEELQKEMDRFRPGDVIYLSVLRGESGLLQIPVRLTEYPDSATSTVHQTNAAPSTPGS